MNDNDLNEMIKKAQYMIQNNQIPDDIKNLVNNFQNQNNSSSSNVQSTNNRNVSNNYSNTQNTNSRNYTNMKNSSNYNSTNSFNTYNTGNNNNSFNNTQNNSVRNNSGDSQAPNIDMETLLKLQSIMSKMKNSSDDDMSRLLLSLKPYLRNGKKEKIDEYIQLIKMGKMTQILNSFGGEKK